MTDGTKREPGRPGNLFSVTINFSEMFARFLPLLTALFAFVQIPVPVSADEPAADVLRRMESRLSGLGRYSVRFEMVYDDVSSAGEYRVDGDDFYIHAGDVEVYSAGGVRYEVDASKREIVVDSADTGVADLLGNPSRGMSAMIEAFDASFVEEDGKRAVKLVPKEPSAVHETVVVVPDASGELPSEIIYSSGSGSVRLKLVEIKRSETDIPRFDRARYGGYDVVEFRPEA